MNIFPVDRMKYEYQALRETILAAGENPDGFVIQQQQLRIHAELINNTTSYTFDLKTGNITNYPLDVLLGQNDRFFAYGLGLQVFKQDTTKSPKEYGNGPRFTFPDPNYFIGTDTTNPEEWAALYTLFNGTLNLKSDVLTYSTKLTTERFLYVPERTTQKQASPMINDEFPEYGTSMERRGIYYLGYQIPLSGQKENTGTLNLAAGNTAVIDGSWTSGGTQTATTRNVLCLCIEGFLVVNAAAPVQKF